MSPPLINAGATTSNQLPAYCQAVHSINKMRLVVQNNGTFGLYRDFFGAPIADCFTGERLDQSCEYPKGTSIENLLYASLWVSAVEGEDTLASTGLEGYGDGREFHPDVSPDGDIVHRSIIDEDAPEFIDAISEEDYISVYSDTLRGTSRDFLYARQHIPLYIKVTQRSFAWSYPYSEDIILVDLEIENVGPRVLNDVYIGLFVDADIGFNGGYRNDDICGYFPTATIESPCGDFEDTLNIAWAADNDGDPIDGAFLVDFSVGNPALIFQRKSAPFAFGTRILRRPDPEAGLSFNWWIPNYDPRFDFGPRRRDNPRDFRTGGIGEPKGDRNKHYIMSNGEIDYDQIFVGEIDALDYEWEQPNLVTAYRISRGADTKYLQSVGPLTIPTTQSVPLTFAFISGENFHNVPGNGGLLYRQPNKYYGNLDFTDLVENARWAGWMYDNPGVDSDGDGYAGKFISCVLDSTQVDSVWRPTQADTIYYTGDGIPDFRGAAPPPAPHTVVTSKVGAFHLRFNGQMSETTRDFLSNEVDFEGYHVWLSRDERASSYSLVASYDRPDFDKYVWNPYHLPAGRYELHELPFTEEELRCAYGQSCDDPYFSPGLYTVGHPYIHPDFPDSVFAFAAHGDNTDQWGLTTPIERVYPDASKPPPGTDLDTLSEDWFTEDGFLKYYEYELTIDNLLPTVPYWVSVTAYDFGSPQSDLDALETSITQSSEMRYPLAEESQLSPEERKVYVYPNPYRLDAGYRINGYEGRNDQVRPGYRLRRIHFVNLPPKCTIRIHSIDGDLIRELAHDMDPADPNNSYDEWDLISRNTQEIVSGMYYWTVEDLSTGEIQMGKLVVIL